MDTVDDQPQTPVTAIDIAGPMGEIQSQLWDMPIRGAWALCWQRPKLWLLVMTPLFAWAMLQSLQSWLSPVGHPPSATATALTTLTSLLSLVTWLAGVALMFAMARERTGGPLTSVRPAYRRIWDLRGPLLGAGCLMVLTAIVLFAVFGMGMIGLMVLTATPPNAADLGTYGLWIGGVITVLLWRPLIALGFWQHYIVLARRGPLEALGDGWRLTRGRVLDLTPYMLLTAVPLAIYLITFGFLRQPDSPTGMRPLAYLGYSLFNVIWSIFTTALWLLLWYRSRVEADAFTLAHFAAELDPSLPVPPPPHQRTVIALDEPLAAPTTPLRRRRRR